MKYEKPSRALKFVFRSCCHKSYASNRAVIGAKFEKSSEQVEYAAIYFSDDEALISPMYVGYNIGYLLNFMLKIHL